MRELVPMLLQVLAMLTKAKQMIDDGHMTAEELDRNLMMNLQVCLPVASRHSFVTDWQACYPCTKLSLLSDDFQVPASVRTPARTKPR